MKFVNIRDFLKDIKSATAELPVTVTRNGTPVFTVIPFDLDKFYLEKYALEAQSHAKDSENNQEPTRSIA